MFEEFSDEPEASLGVWMPLSVFKKAYSKWSYLNKTYFLYHKNLGLNRIRIRSVWGKAWIRMRILIQQNVWIRIHWVWIRIQWIRVLTQVFYVLAKTLHISYYITLFVLNTGFLCTGENLTHTIGAFTSCGGGGGDGWGGHGIGGTDGDERVRKIKPLIIFSYLFFVKVPLQACVRLQALEKCF